MKPARTQWLKSTLLASLWLLSSCTDRLTLLGPGAVDEPDLPRAMALSCTVDITAEARMRCVSADAGSEFIGALHPGLSNAGARVLGSLIDDPAPSALVLGGQGINVLLANSGNSVVGGVFSTNVTVKNLLGQAIGTTDGTTAVAEGVRVFFASGPTAVGGGSIALLDTDGTANFTASGQPYYQYSQKLAPNETSSAKTWKFQFNGGATQFVFGVYVWAPVQYPDGWVDVSPASAELNLADNSDLTIALTAPVKNRLGRTLSGESVTFGSSDASIASVNSSGLVTAHKIGTATITATAGTRTGTSVITVIQPVSLSQSTVTAGSSALVADGASSTTITVRLRDALAQQLTASGGTVVLATSAGGTLSAVTDHNDGSYTATLTAPNTAGATTTITAKVNGNDISDNATVQFVAAAQAPVAQNDEVANGSVPGDPWHTALNTALNVADGSGADLLTNDDLGAPNGSITSFGAVQCNDGDGALNSATGTSTSNNAGATLSLAGITDCGGGSLTVNANGSFTYVPSATYNGLFSFKYRVTNSAGTSDATVTLAVGVRASANNSSYPATLLGNVAINTATSTNTTVNALGDRITYTVTGANHGVATIAANGTYEFTPDPGFSGTADFSYTAKNRFGESTPATVTLAVGTRVWFVDAAAPAGGNGRLDSPFNCLVGASGCFSNAATGSNDVVWLAHGAYSNPGPLVLQPGQQLIGEGGNDTFAALSGLSWPADAGPMPNTQATAPTLASAAGNVITLGQNNTLRGVTLLTGVGGTSLFGSSFGTLLVGPDLCIDTDEAAVDLTTGTLNGDFCGVTTRGGSNSLRLTDVAGTSNFGGGSLQGATNSAVRIKGGGGDWTYDGSISGNARPANVQDMTGGLVTLTGNINGTRDGILIQNNTGGTVTFSGASKVLVTGPRTAVSILNNSGGTVRFTEGGLDISTGSGVGFEATGGGGLVVRGSHNRIVTSGAAAYALNLNAAFIGTNGFSLDSIYAGIKTTAAGANLVNLVGPGTVEIAALTVNGGVVGLNISNNSVPVAVTPNIAGVTGNGVNLTSIHSQVLLCCGAITNPGGDAISVNGGDKDVVVLTDASKTNAGRIVNVTGWTNNALVFAGNLNCTTSCTGINVSGNTDGNVEFAGLTKTLNTGANDAITLNNNAAATVKFTYGGLALTTTTGAGINASGGGKLQVSGPLNTALSTGGTAVRINGYTIGGGGVTFQSIATNGGSKGISLNNTGAGFFTVTGTGAAGSGGTIQNASVRGAEFIDAAAVRLAQMTFQTNATGADNASCNDAAAAAASFPGDVCQAAVYLKSATGVVLDSMSVSGSGNFGVWGWGVNGFTARNLTASQNGNGVGEDAVQLMNVSGDVVFRRGSYSNSAARAIDIFNTTGAANVSVSNTTISNSTFPAGSPAAGGVFIGSGGSSGAAITSSVTSTTFRRIFGSAFAADAAGNSTQTITFGGSGSGNTIATASNGVSITGSSSGDVTYSVVENVVTQNPANVSAGTVFSVRQGAAAAGTWSGTITGNTVGTNGSSKSGCGTAGCAAISATNYGGSGTHTTTITGNQIYRTSAGINVGVFNAAAGLLRATIMYNTVADPEANAVGASTVQGPGINAEAGAATGASASLMVRADSNTVSGNWDEAGVKGLIRIRKAGDSASTVSVCGYNPAVDYDGNATPGETSDVAAFILTVNPLSTAPGGYTVGSGSSGLTGPGC